MISIDQFNQITKEKKCAITLMLPFHPVILGSYIFDIDALSDYFEHKQITHTNSKHNPSLQLKHPITNTPVTQKNIDDAMTHQYHNLYWREMSTLLQQCPDGYRELNIDMPEQAVLNLSPERFDHYLKAMLSQQATAHLTFSILRKFIRSNQSLLTNDFFNLISTNRPDILSQTSQNGLSIAHAAAACGQTNALDWILEHIPDIFSQTDQKGQTIAHAAAQYKHTNVLDCILEHRPDILSQTTQQGHNIAHFAATRGHINTLNWIREHTPDILSQTTQHGLSIAHSAAQYGQTNVLDWIQTHTPDILSQTDQQGISIAHFAAARGHTNVLNWIREHQPNILSQTDQQGFSIAHFTATREYICAAGQIGQTYALDWIFEHQRDLLVDLYYPTNSSPKITLSEHIQTWMNHHQQDINVLKRSLDKTTEQPSSLDKQHEYSDEPEPKRPRF